MFGFADVTKVLPPGKKGCAEVEHFSVSREESVYTSLRPCEYVPEENYVRLLVKGQLMMSNTRMEQITNLNFLRQAKGDVLIAGLGIGLILLPGAG